jgi:hypothetical protein
MHEIEGTTKCCANEQLYWVWSLAWQGLAFLLRNIQVVRYKHADKDGVTSLVLGCGSKKEKQLHPCAVGEFRR